MDKVKVSRKSLLTVVETNREQHREEFLKAQEGWRAKVIEELDRRLANARAGRKYDAYFSMPEPQEHTKDYDRVILMLKMSVDDVIEISQEDFGRYALDDWEWKPAWTVSNSAYVAAASKN